jgi:hypothetical protein
MIKRREKGIIVGGNYVKKYGDNVGGNYVNRNTTNYLLIKHVLLLTFTLKLFKIKEQ